MADPLKVIELFSSSNDASSSDSEPRHPPNRSSHGTNRSEQAYVKTTVRSNHGVQPSTKTSGSSSEREELHFEQRKPSSSRRKVDATTPYVAPTSRHCRAHRETQELTEGMKFFELQAQEQLMARFRAQKRRNAPESTSPSNCRRSKQVVDPSRPWHETRSGRERHRKEQALNPVEPPTNTQTAAFLARGATKRREREAYEKEWTTFTEKSAQRESLRRQNGLVVETNGEKVEKKGLQSSDYHKPGRVTQPVARTLTCTKRPAHLKTAERNKRRRVVPITSKSSVREVESEQESDEQSDDDEVERVTLRQETVNLRKKAISNRSAADHPKQWLDKNLLPVKAAEASSKTVVRGANETQHLAEKMPLRELQEQEKLLLYFHAQKKRNLASFTSPIRKGGHKAHMANTTDSTNSSGRRARMGVNQNGIPGTPSPLSDIAPPSRNGFLASTAQFVSAAGCTATPVKKLTNPVIHSTAWRRLVFDEAPLNILDGVSATPYSLGSDRPLWAYDTTGELKKKSKFIEVGITKDISENQPPSQSEVNSRVRAMVEQELPQIKTFHARRVRHILKETREQLSEYLKAHQVLRGERSRRLQWSDVANHQHWLNLSLTELAAAKRALQHSTHTVQPYNHLVGSVRYFVKREQTSFESLVYPETVIHLPNDITAIRRSFTMIGIRKNTFVEDDPILRYVPYLGEGKRMVIDNDLYSETTMSKERHIAVFGEGEELKVLNPSARNDEIMEYLLRVIVGICGASEEVFLALKHAGGFDRPRIDYCSMKDHDRTEQRIAGRILKTKEMAALHQKVSADEIPEMLAAEVNASKALWKLAQSHWFLRDESEPQLLAIRLHPPLSVFESNYADSLETLGIRDRPTYEGLVESHRDLFCRRCYSYDCFEHGIQNPQRSFRADPIYPMVSVPGIVLARQVVPIQEGGVGAEDGCSCPMEVFELIDSSSSDDEIQESKCQQSPVAESSLQSTTLYRRSRRTQTRMSSLASKSLQTQEKMLETERLAELEKRKKRREKFARSADKSEYLDNSYLPAVTASLKKLLSKAKSCGSSCWLSAGDVDPSKVHAPQRQFDYVLVRKLVSMLGSNACIISAMLNSPSCTCAQISTFLAKETVRRDSGDNLEGENELLVPLERQREGRRSAGVGSNRSLAKRIREQCSYDREKRLSYEPCNHDGVCDETCKCTKRGHSCNKTCSCPRDCPNRFQGCKCSTGNCHTSACPCWSAGRECDPDYCFNCGASDAAVMTFHPEFKSRSPYNLNICHNVHMICGSIQKKIGVALSATHGWGAYALEPIRKDEFVLEYTGELITDDEAERRGAIYDRKSVSYLFGVNSDYVVDAARKGNKAKFANHRSKEEANLDVKVIASNGEHRIGLFAREAIEVGTEVFFDYGYTHGSAPKWSQHDRTQPEKRAYDIVDDENEWE